MKRNFLHLFITFICLVFFLFVTNTTHAANFSTDYSLTYTVHESSLTTATITVVLTNTTDDYYASSYTLEVGFDDIQNVRASDPDGKITPRVEKSENGNKISLGFNKRVVGEGNSLKFTVLFDTSDVAQKRGTVWEVDIPGIANPQDFADFSVNVEVPKSFGSPVYKKPEVNAALTFTKEQLGKSGISIAFGDVQYYDFTLSYHLQNKNVFPVRTEIALPPTTNYQEVFIDSMQPRPRNVTRDADGNWLAEYYLYPSQKIDVVVSGTAEMSLFPKSQRFNEADLKKYTAKQQFWEVSDPRIQKLARDLQTPEAIYDYVVDTLTYDFTRVSQNLPRLGAKKSLTSPSSAVCREFTDLFVAIARAAGIPARELNGFAYTENSKQRPLSLVQDILHAWPEYYDREKQAWIMVDPTWGNTTGGVDYFYTLDFDHFVFAIKGSDSEYPIPAGGYKYEGLEDKRDVSVSFTEMLKKPSEKTSIASQFPQKSFPWVAVTGAVRVTNESGVATKPHVISVATDFLRPKLQEFSVASIPPFGYVDIPVTLKNPSLLTNSQSELTITMNNKSVTDSIQITPFIISKRVVLGGISIASFTIIISFIAIKARRLLLQRHKE